MAYTRCRVKRAKLATDPEMSAITKISGLAGRGCRKRGLDRHAPGGQRAPHGGPEVERTLAAVTALAGQPHRQLARQRVEDPVQHGQLVAGGVHDVDVLGQRLAHRAGQRLGTVVLDQPAADLGLDGPAELLDARLELVRRQALLQIGQRPAGGARPGPGP